MPVPIQFGSETWSLGELAVTRGVSKLPLATRFCLSHLHDGHILATDASRRLDGLESRGRLTGGKYKSSLNAPATCTQPAPSTAMPSPTSPGLWAKAAPSIALRVHSGAPVTWSY